MFRESLLKNSDVSVREKILDSMASNLLLIRLARKVFHALSTERHFDRKKIVFGLLLRAIALESEANYERICRVQARMNHRLEVFAFKKLRQHRDQEKELKSFGEVERQMYLYKLKKSNQRAIE